MEISIIVPVYNTECYLKECLDSLVNQNFESYEIICIDDCSTDASLEILNLYKDEYPNLFTILSNDENIGQGRSRERGIRRARGTFIMFVDSDDYVQPEFLRTYYQYAMQRELDVVAGGYIRDIDGELFVEAAPGYPWNLTTYSILCSKMFRLGFLKDNKIRFSRQRRGEDIFFNLNCYCQSARCESIDYAGYCCRLNRASTTRTISSSSNFECDITEMFKELIDHLSGVPISYSKRNMLCYAYIVNMINALVVYGHGCGIKRMHEKYQFFCENARNLFPQYRANPILTQLRMQSGQTTKIRYSIWFLMNLHKCHLDFFAYAVIALL